VADEPGRIVVSGLSKRFGSVQAVDGLSFTVEPGSVTGFLGPNGAGKTTTLRCTLGLVTPTAGTATIGGLRYADLPHPLRTVGAVLESSSFHPGRTARNHLRVYCAAESLPNSRADEVLETVGLTGAAKRKVRGYSLGMRQRLGLAFALLGDPTVLILDEPANGLDPEGIKWLRGFMRHYADTGGTVLVSSHLLGEIEQIADRIVILARGRLVREGTLDELTEGAGRAVVVRSPDSEKLADALEQAASPTPDGQVGVHVQRTGPDMLRVTGLEAAAVGHTAFTAHAELHQLSTEKSDLEQIFFELTSEGQGEGVTALDPTAAAVSGGER
jgi:ABC-2 type transport system ATP-binding protein